MNKTEFVKALAEGAKLTKRQAEEVYGSWLHVVASTLKKGEKIQLVGFGTYDIKKKPAREVYNPLTKKKVKIAASRVPSFRIGKAFKKMF